MKGPRYASSPADSSTSPKTQPMLSASRDAVNMYRSFSPPSPVISCCARTSFVSVSLYCCSNNAFFSVLPCSVFSRVSSRWLTSASCCFFADSIVDASSNSFSAAASISF